MAIPSALRVLAKAAFKPSTAWAFLFFPALFYYMGTRLRSLGLFRSSTYGEILRPELSWVHPSTCSEKLLYVTKSCASLSYPLYLVQEDLKSVVSTAWMEDEELGRGYLLVSTSQGNGKVYRWEAGGGPIAIGRTLHLNDSGCRSNLYRECSGHGNLGSGGIAVDAFSDPPLLMVAEYGEGRIVRLEENGARTPLIIATSDKKRLVEPFRLATTPYGDLMVIDKEASNRSTLWRLPKASKVPGLLSLSVSRQAHSWKQNNETGLPHIFFQSQDMGGMVLDPSGRRILVTTTAENEPSILVASLSLVRDDDEESESQDHKMKVFFDYTSHASRPGAIEVDQHGNLYLAVDDGILVVDQTQTSVAKITFPYEERIVDLTLGSDRFLYVAMESNLARMRVPNSPLDVKDLMVKAKWTYMS